MRHLVALFVLSFAKLRLRLNLVHETCYMTSSYAIHFKGAADFGEAQLELSQRCWHGELPSASFQLRATLAGPTVSTSGRRTSSRI